METRANKLKSNMTLGKLNPCTYLHQRSIQCLHAVVNFPGNCIHFTCLWFTKMLDSSQCGRLEFPTFDLQASRMHYGKS